MRLSTSILTTGAVLASSASLSNGYVVSPISRRSSDVIPSMSTSTKKNILSSRPTIRTHLFNSLQQDNETQQQHQPPLLLQQQQQQPQKLQQNSNTALQMSDTVVDEIMDAELLQADKDDRINNIALINGVALATVVACAAYNLAHVQVEALVALWEYDLGPHGPEITKAAVALDLFSRLPVDAVRSYEALVPTNPIFYKACTSGVAYGLGDFISQVYQGRTMSTIDLPRSLRSGAAGFIGHGPLCHYWLQFMETYLDFNGAWWATGIKVTADLTVWSIFLSASYSFIIGVLALRDPRDIWKDVKTTTWPALRSAWRFWPFVHTVSFSHAVPLDLKLLWVDVMEVVWVTILSKVANEDKNAKLQAEEAVETLDIVEPFGTMPELEIELTREAELNYKDDANHSDLAFELPKKVLAACWPLIAMWPVLYAGYQFERFLGLEI